MSKREMFENNDCETNSGIFKDGKNCTTNGLIDKTELIVLRLEIVGKYIKYLKEYGIVIVSFVMDCNIKDFKDSLFAPKAVNIFGKEDSYKNDFNPG